MSKYLSFILLLFILQPNLYAQKRYLSLGTRTAGICFGNSPNYNGIRFGLWDEDAGSINGLNVSALTSARKFNGLNIGLLGSGSATINGVAVNILGVGAEYSRGVMIGGMFNLLNCHSGVAVGMTLQADTLNGLGVGMGIGNSAFGNPSKGVVLNGIGVAVLGCEVAVLNGLAASLVTNLIQVQHGVSIAAYNKTQELHGVQFGLLNYAGNNRKLFRWMPLVNFNFRKRNNS
jgi:hypothetical protein